MTAADLLALAAFEEDVFAQSFPSFGSERTGAPVVSYCRLDRRTIRTRQPVTTPDCVVVIDPTLVHQVDLFDGLGPEGYLLMNSARSCTELGLGTLERRLRPGRALTVAATDVARRVLGRPMPNAALLGGFAALTGQIQMSSVAAAIRERFGREPALAERNVAAASEVFGLARQSLTGDGRSMLDAPAV